MSDAATLNALQSREKLGCDLAAEVLRTSGNLRLRVNGASMLPVVWPGDILSVQSHDAAAALPGDVVLFGRAGHLVAHRVVKRITRKGQIHWVTRGDTSCASDNPVSHQELLGRVTDIERRGRRFSPQQTAFSQFISGIARRSEFATRVMLWFRLRY